jgi:translation elongation factor EF-1alpha
MDTSDTDMTDDENTNEKPACDPIRYSVSITKQTSTTSKRHSTGTRHSNDGTSRNTEGKTLKVKNVEETHCCLSSPHFDIITFDFSIN